MGQVQVVVSPKPDFSASADHEFRIVFPVIATQPCSDKGLPKQGGAPYLGLCSCQPDPNWVKRRAFLPSIGAKLRIVSGASLVFRQICILFPMGICPSRRKSRSNAARFCNRWSARTVEV